VTPLLLALALAVGAPALKDKPAAVDLHGEWELVATTADDPPPRVFRFNPDGTWQIFRGGKEKAERRGFALDPKAVPRALDLDTVPAPRTGPLARGIYKVGEDELTICSARPGKRRPTEFAAPAGSDDCVMRFRRVKPKE
jgi:uncharacterized protein (TIGR03067 family)